MNRSLEKRVSRLELELNPPPPDQQIVITANFGRKDAPVKSWSGVERLPDEAPDEHRERAVDTLVERSRQRGHGVTLIVAEPDNEMNNGEIKND